MQRLRERKKVEQLSARYCRAVGQVEQLQEQVRLLTAPGAQPSLVQRLREWWGGIGESPTSSAAG